MIFYSQTISLNFRCYYKSKQSQIISQKVSTNCTSLVPYGTNLGSTLNMDRLSKNLQRLIYLPYNIYSIIVGKLLSDGWLDKENLNANTRFRFKQAVARSDYVIYSFLLLSHYCSSVPNLDLGNSNGTVTYGLQIITRRYPCLNELYHLFYKNKIKIIPYSIYDLLTPIALANFELIGLRVMEQKETKV
uniref:LAGLIDADG homing endonuclease n=1 Tax=Phanerochaete carnosa TaxID=231932 RepID=A0A895KTC4_9APHY|nr:LAGLIDADG homing endonuclease [Phanerochaete carnosa]QRZ60406.1 LAGLIDADG homing endonuclease [Phanerochaete carnosa]